MLTKNITCYIYIILYCVHLFFHITVVGRFFVGNTKNALLIVISLSQLKSIRQTLPTVGIEALLTQQATQLQMEVVLVSAEISGTDISCSEAAAVP